MTIYLPIAEMSVNVFVLLGLGALVGMLSGIFGVGGGFLMTPLLLFIGIPPAVAVATQANQIVGLSISGVLGHWRRGNVDVRMGLVLMAGGLVGSVIGVALFRLLRSLGQVDLAVSLSYVVFLGLIGGLMFVESLSTIFRNRRRKGGSTARGPGRHGWMHRLPFKIRFYKSKLYISALMPLAVGLMVGLLSAIMGVGGGFVMVPAMIYLLGMPTQVVVGTSLFQIIFVAANTTFLQAMVNHSVDVVLALLLMVGGVIGAQLGVMMGRNLKGEQLRIMLAAIVLLVCGKLAWDLVATPSDLYSIVQLPVEG